MKRNIHFQQIFKAISLPCLLLRPEGMNFIIEDVNDGYLEATQRAPKDLIHKTINTAFFGNRQEDGSSKLIQSLQKVLETSQKDIIKKSPFYLPVKGENQLQEKFWKIENTPLLNQDGETEMILHMLQDVTEQVLLESRKTRFEKELLRNRQQYLQLMENHPDGLFTLNPKIEITSANKGLISITNRDLNQLMGQSFLSLFTVADHSIIREKLEAALKGEACKLETTISFPKETSKVLEISLVPMEFEHSIIGAYGIAKDITNLKNSEKVLVEKRRFLKANATFISTLFENELDENELKQAFEVVGKAVDVDRMYCFTAHSDAETGEVFISQRVEWTSETATSQIDNPEMQNMPASRLNEIMGSLTKNEPFSAALHDLPAGALREIFVDQDIKAMLLLPIFLKNHLYGFIGFDDCRRERRWKEEEVTFLKSLAQNYTTALEKNRAEQEVKNQEQALKRSEQKFRALVQEGSDLLAILDLKGHYKFVSETTSNILGIPPQDFIGRSVFEFIHPDDQELVRNRFQDLEKQKQTKIGPFRLRNNEGKWGWFHTTATNLIKDPAVQGVVANTRDITTTMEQAREIEHLNERYRLAATATKDLMYDWDINNNEVIRFHRNLTDLLGYPVEEIEKDDFWSENIHPEDFSSEMTRRKRALVNPRETFISSEYRFKREDGTYAKVIDRGFILRNNEGKAIRLVGAIRDISDITAKEEALRVANKRFNTALEATNEMVWDWDIKSDHVIRSKTFRKIFGYNIKQNPSMEKFWLTKIIGKDKERVKNSLTEALQDPTQNRWKEEYRFLKANGEATYIIDRGFIIRDKNGHAIRMVGAVLDVTESRRLIKKIKKQNKVLRDIAWEQSHVVRAPLARLKSLLKFMEMGIFDDMSQEEIWQQIIASTEELDEIVKSIVSKTEEIEYQLPEKENTLNA